MRILIFLVFLIGSFSLSFAQIKTIEPERDSARFEQERKEIVTQQIQLRDSINISLAQFKAKIDKTPVKKRGHLEKARKDLMLTKEVLQRDINEVGLTSKNSWTDQNIKRLKIDVDQFRREYLQLKSHLKNN